MKEMGDVGGQLAWLEVELKKVEENDNVVYGVWIIGNLNPGSRFCNVHWARRYNTLVERYQSIIRMQLFGHEEESYY